ncbi:MAG: hypothetical protein ACYCZO_17075 [Daejeonella sp.]
MIEIAKAHPYSHGAKGFQISPLMQEKMVFAGQYDNYGSCNKLIETFLKQPAENKKASHILLFWQFFLDDALTNLRRT